MAASVFKPDWMDDIEPTPDVFIVVQGLLVYLKPETVRRQFCPDRRAFSRGRNFIRCDPTVVLPVDHVGRHANAVLSLAAYAVGHRR